MVYTMKIPRRLPKKLRGLKKRDLPTKLCRYCREPFVVTRPDRETCAKVCGTLLWRQENPEAAQEQRRRVNLKARFGLSVEEYDRLYERQGEGCAGCGRPADQKRRLAVDHDHKTRKVRGLLCFRCNTIVGKAGEDPGVLQALAGYLRRGGV